MKELFYYPYLILILLFTMSFFSIKANTLKLSSSSSVSYKPNMAVVQITIATKDKKAAQAVEKNAEKIKNVLEYLKKKLSSQDKVHTTNYQVSPNYQWDDKNRQNILIGYESSMQLEITEDNLTQLGALLDDLVNISSIEINSVNLENNNTEKYQQHALTQAIKKGIAQAHALATAAGVNLEKLQHLETLSSMSPAPVYKMNTLLATTARQSTPIAQGDLTLSESVQLIFNIKAPKGSQNI